MKKVATVIIAIVIAAVAMAQKPTAGAIEHTYCVPCPLNDDTAHLEMRRNADGTYEGRIVWANRLTNADGTPRRDEKNKDPKLRTRKAMGLTMVWGLKYKNGEWTDGKVYDYTTGNTYSIKISTKDNGQTLQVRYYKGVPLVGISSKWKKVK